MKKLAMLALGGALCLGGCPVVVTEDGQVLLCLSGTYSGTFENSTKSNSFGSTFNIDNDSDLSLTFGDDFQPESLPLSVGLLQTSDPDDLTDAPWFTPFGAGQSGDFSYTTTENLGDTTRSIVTDVNVTMNEVLWGKSSFYLGYSFTGTQWTFPEGADTTDPEQSDGTFNFSGSTVTQAFLVDQDHLQFSNASWQNVTDEEGQTLEVTEQFGTAGMRFEF